MPPPARRPSPRRTLLAGGLWLAAGAGACAQPPTLPPPAPVPFAADRVPPELALRPSECVTRYTLSEALAIAHAKHPQLDALKASMNATLLKQRGLGEVKRSTSIFAGFVIPDYEVRTQQADLGLLAARAELFQAEHEVTYAVVRCYFTVVYAREQQKVVRDLVNQLEDNLKYVLEILNDKERGQRGITTDTRDQLTNAVETARRRLVEAEMGTERARAALREAMGLEPLCQVDVATEGLPDVPAVIARDTVKAHAVTRRGEITMTEIGADVTRLEVYAQWTRKLTLMAYTYANATDIHARPIPPPQRDPYKPGAIGPEMPDRLLGKAETRAATAGQYADRQAAGARQARSLIALEAENAWTHWAESVQKVKSARVGAEAARQIVERSRDAAGARPRKEDVILNELSTTQAFAALNEALYDQIVALANLERVTAGGIKLNIAGRVAP